MKEVSLDNQTTSQCSYQKNLSCKSHITDQMKKHQVSETSVESKEFHLRQAKRPETRSFNLSNMKLIMCFASATLGQYIIIIIIITLFL